MKSLTKIKKNKNVLRRLLGRETLGKASTSFSNASITNKFQNFCLRDSFDTHDPKASELRLSFLKKRSKIIEIVAAKDVMTSLCFFSFLPLTLLLLCRSSLPSQPQEHV